MQIVAQPSAREAWGGRRPARRGAVRQGWRRLGELSGQKVAMTVECMLPYYPSDSSVQVAQCLIPPWEITATTVQGECVVSKCTPIFENDFIQIGKRGDRCTHRV